MVVMVEAILSKIGYVEVGPSIVVVVSNSHAIAPSVIGYSCLYRYIGKSSVVVVMEKRGMRGFCFTSLRFVGGAIHEIDIEPSIVVVIDQCNAGTNRIDDEFLGRIAHVRMPGPKSRLFGDVLEDDGAVFNKSACSDWTMFLVQHRRQCRPGGRSALRCLRGRGSRSNRRRRLARLRQAHRRCSRQKADEKGLSDR